MKVKTLISILKTHDPELTICVDGYESGITEKLWIGVVGITPNYYSDDVTWADEHEIPFPPNPEAPKVLLISHSTGNRE